MSLSITPQYTEGAADTDDANECFTQPHYEPQREVVFLGFFLLFFPHGSIPSDGGNRLRSSVLELKREKRKGNEGTGGIISVCVCVTYIY